MADTTPFDRFVPTIEAGLRDAVATPHPLIESFYGMMRYHLGFADEQLQDRQAAGGKCVRPVLTLVACEAVGGDSELAMSAALAVELIHNFSLVHDDIQDRSDFRRHRPTVWKLWGDAQAINVGDGLFAVARLELGRMVERGVSIRNAAAASRAFDEACVALTEGQYLDLAFEAQGEVSLDDYLWMVRGKTAALLACACQLGGIVAGAETPVVRSLYDFGYNLGMAFQIEDDILGIWGDPEITGKPAGDDILSRKKSLPVVYAWEEGFSPRATEEKRRAAEQIKQVYQSAEVSASGLQAVLDALDVVEARPYCVSMSQDYTALAMQAASHPGLAASSAEDLKWIARALLRRSH